jgi:hypothetical protein
LYIITMIHGGMSGKAISRKCPPNTYLTEIHGSHSADRVTQICGKCSDGATLPCEGKAGPTTFRKVGPFSEVKFKTGSLVDNIMGAGGLGGGDRITVCPENKYVDGYDGRAGDWIDAIGFGCGYSNTIPGGIPGLIYGSPAGGSIEQKCPSNTYLSEIYGSHAADRVTQICGKCSDGTTLSCAGKQGPTEFKKTGPFTEVDFKTGAFVDSIMGSGGPNGGSRKITCPTNTYVDKYIGRSGDWIDAIGFDCGYTKPTGTNTAGYTKPSETNTVNPSNTGGTGTGGTTGATGGTGTGGTTGATGGTGTGGTTGATGGTGTGGTTGATGGTGTGGTTGATGGTGTSDSKMDTRTIVIIVIIVVVVVAALIIGLTWRRKKDKIIDDEENEIFTQNQNTNLNYRLNQTPLPNTYPQPMQQYTPPQQPMQQY